MGAALLAARGLAAGYRGRRVLDRVDLELRAGEILAVIGPNGAGKTTLFRAFAGELPILAGEILVGNGGAMRPIGTLPLRARALLVARVLQGEEPAWALPVEDYVRAGTFAVTGWLGAEGEAEEDAARSALRETDLVEIAHRPVTELSGGEFRRVLIARALAQGSRILLLDEPAAGLDLGRQMELLGLLRRLSATGKAVALVVHDLNLAAMVADRVALLAGGRITAIGSPRDVITAGRVEETYGAQVIVRDHPLGDIPQVVNAPPWLHSRDAEPNK